MGAGPTVITEALLPALTFIRDHGGKVCLLAHVNWNILIFRQARITQDDLRISLFAPLMSRVGVYLGANAMISATMFIGAWYTPNSYTQESIPFLTVITFSTLVKQLQ
ncbi:hypothetical protein DEU56DRAFT_903232, partial [Suillus clintonianus]|uniref:uncharacterized protein n=1 Tax=Suillus clintonianus TaxID=1904413 RepID=UPI001B883C24